MRKCPLRGIRLNIKGKDHVGEPRDCLEDKCRWWYSPTKVCEFNRLSDNLERIAQALEDIYDRMGIVH